MLDEASNAFLSGRFDDTFDYGLVKSHKCLNELLIAFVSIELLKIKRNDPFI